MRGTCAWALGLSCRGLAAPSWRGLWVRPDFRADFFALFLILGVDNRSETWYDITCRQATWCHGSVGRAHRSHRWGRRFESYWHHAQKKSPPCGWLFSVYDNSRERSFGTLRGERTSTGHFPLRCQWRKQQGKMLSDRAQRDRRFESYWHHAPVFKGCFLLSQRH